MTNKGFYWTLTKDRKLKNITYTLIDVLLFFMLTLLALLMRYVLRNVVVGCYPEGSRWRD